MGDRIKEIVIEDPPKPTCPVHGEDVPVINIESKDGDKYQIAGRWCVVCLFKVVEQLGARRTE